MTANELADAIQYCGDGGYNLDAATMLRQQQEKIDRLLDQYQQLNENLEMWKTGHFKQQAEIEQLKALVISLSPNANLIYTRSEK